ASQGSTTFSESNAKAWDAEFDTLYFTGDQGELAFAPTSNSAITEVAVSNDKGASWMALTAEEGLYTAPITSGNNILRVTTETGTAYQVVRGDKISTRLVNVTDPGQPFEAGDTVRVILDGLHTPIPKMAGNYNPGAKDSFAEGAGSLIQLNYTFCGSPVQGTGRQYDFITSGNAVEVTIPESEDGTVVSLQDGYIGLGVIGLTKFADGGDSHRNIPDGGCVTRDSKATAHTRSVLPDITIEVGGLPTGNTAPYIRDNAAETATITLGKTYAVNLTTIFGDREGDTLTYKLAAGEDAAAIDSYYTFTPETVGSYTLIFTANDGQLDSKPHTVTLTVKEAPAEEPDGPAAPDFGLSKDEIDGYVYVSFEDKGVRVAGDEGTYPKALGTILKKTRVPYTQGDTIADVTLRALDAYDFTYSHTGTTKSNFYLSSIGSFTVKGIDYDSFGEFDAGTGSGWMITWDDVFINKGASEFQVENGDVIRWQYTCQLGADIGDDGSAVGGGNQAPQVPPEVLPEVPPVTSSPYTDVTGHWAEKAITFVYEKGLMTGTKEDTFSPETELSRAMLVTILYRMEGEPAVIAQNTFSDVTDGTWYTNAVIWASQNGIVNGVGKDRFAPDRDITREQMAAMLLRYSDYKEYDTTQRNDLAGYTDAESISGWALEALQWANGEGLITGRKADLLVPQGDTTRAETATILMRYLETIA
ncbi:MAG: S-layer homology domain-containing protein, partial [Ruminiclostridium sp.]|nr:S-layer homology domain-containing protein [Ruminiclostridium sp.]